MAKSKWDNVKDKLILIEGWARDGLTNEQIATNLGISKTTFYKYVNEHSELSELLKKGKEIIDYEVENALLKSALDGNITAQIYWLNNRRPNKWKNQRYNKNENESQNTERLQIINDLPEEKNETN